MPSETEIVVHPQLASYQVAVEAGGFGAGEASGGAEIVAVGTTSNGPAVRTQPPLQDSVDPGWAEGLVRRAAATVAALLSVGTSPLTGEELRRRAEEALAQEIRLMLDEGVVAEAADIDLCMLLGAGWPFYNGGVTPYLDRQGVSERVTGRRFS